MKSTFGSIKKGLKIKYLLMYSRETEENMEAIPTCTSALPLGQICGPLKPPSKAEVVTVAFRSLAVMGHSR